MSVVKHLSPLTPLCPFVRWHRVTHRNCHPALAIINLTISIRFLYFHLIIFFFLPPISFQNAKIQAHAFALMQQVSTIISNLHRQDALPPSFQSLVDFFARWNYGACDVDFLLKTLFKLLPEFLPREPRPVRMTGIVDLRMFRLNSRVSNFSLAFTKKNLLFDSHVNVVFNLLFIKAPGRTFLPSLAQVFVDDRKMVQKS